MTEYVFQNQSDYVPSCTGHLAHVFLLLSYSLNNVDVSLGLCSEVKTSVSGTAGWVLLLPAKHDEPSWPGERGETSQQCVSADP